MDPLHSPPFSKGDKGGFKVVSPFFKGRCKRDFYLYEKFPPTLQIPLQFPLFEPPLASPPCRRGRRGGGPPSFSPFFKGRQREIEFLLGRRMRKIFNLFFNEVI